MIETTQRVFSRRTHRSFSPDEIGILAKVYELTKGFRTF
jgi:hypothetical protein